MSKSGVITEHPASLLAVKGLKKKIGAKWIIQDVSFEIGYGEIFGFLGPNGSGKTTTIRMLVDLIKPTEGKVLVAGYDVHRQPEQALAQIGCIVENPEVYDYLSGWENLEHFARMLADVDGARIHEVVEIVGLQQRIHDKVKTYSLGMRQRLGIAQALLGRPKLLILDEPTNGLDPKGIKELREFIRMLAGQGMSLFISSHLLSEIQMMCDRVAIINAGRVLAVGTVNELLADRMPYVIWQVQQREKAIQLMANWPELRIVPAGEHLLDETTIGSLHDAIVTLLPSDKIAGLVARLVQEGVAVNAVAQAAPTLEQLFLKMTEGEGIV